MPVTEIESVAKLGEYVGQEVAVSDWLDVTQARINQFAEATEDRQWIHVDPERAARESPFKQPIAHGFLTLSLLSELMRLGDVGRRRADGPQLRFEPRALHRARAGRGAHTRALHAG